MVEEKFLENKVCSSGFAVIRANSKIINHKFLFYYLISDIFINPLNESQVGSSYPAVKDKDIFSQPIPLPPLEEQHEIVSRVEKLFALADAVEGKYQKSMQRLKKLEQSVLAKAFRGELIEPDPNDESAEELLKKILKEKQKLQGEVKKNKKSKFE
ncbi:MAG TPA: restriction endonuclease subunit S [Ignavibacteriales bacterium]|nr:restriction endonuclease subunit S [Ignavibacteriales bacterium]HOL81096.1 restriction endonuclease subunit S [Ignavibacteriales bacterium]HPD66492.1 restriction endonuclease subunit S [Ignavibacteriales bacterium]HPP34459.1 restriction endonuclease subunit S [Ignavibacteriales bacterium]HRR19730.1 restriction endonuclease subunit S [Ignavibacteriales bacterium]